MPKIRVEIDIDSGETTGVWKVTGNQVEPVEPKSLLPPKSGKGKKGPIQINGKTVWKVPDYTFVFAKDSPGCVWYTSGGRSWCICT